MRKIVLIICLVFSLWNNFVHSASNLEIGQNKFILDGKPFVIKAAELHYPRIPEPYWEQRIQLCKALGMNTLCLYTFWNIHEQNPGVFDFDGQNNIRRFIELCRDNEMNVILRPGPYVCAEWEMGGLPWWLLKETKIDLRESDPRFLHAVDRFWDALSHEIADLTVDKGGPIIMIQVENEYGSYGINREYVSEIRDLVRKYFGEKITLFQCDWSSNFLNNGLNDLLWTLNFGSGANIKNQFEPLITVRPESPLMCSEFWSGWFDKWGANHETRPPSSMIEGIEEMLRNNISFSLYMTHGGTNWGHWAGANSPGYAPDVTSYDYDAPISESGQLTDKYWMLRSVLQNYSENKLPDIPELILSDTLNNIVFKDVAPLMKNLPFSIKDSSVRTMEHYDQGYGSILYRTIIPDIINPVSLEISEIHDYAQIFINNKKIGSLDRRFNEKELPITEIKLGDTLDILVEGMGRINFGRTIKDYKGITESVILNCLDSPKDLKGWEIFLLPDKYEFYENMKFDKMDYEGKLPAGAYRAKFYVDKAADTFLDLSTWGKGFVYINGINLGRFWNIGPQQTLYLPGCWLREGENEILVFDILGPKTAETKGLKRPILDKIQNEKITTSFEFDPKIEDLTLLHEFLILPINNWQFYPFSQPSQMKVISLEFEKEKESATSIYEITLVDREGGIISPDRWKVLYADSEENLQNHTAEKSFDLQETTFWESESSLKPNMIIIDLGKEEVVSGLKILFAPSSLKSFKIRTK